MSEASKKQSVASLVAVGLVSMGSAVAATALQNMGRDRALSDCKQYAVHKSDFRTLRLVAFSECLEERLGISLDQ